MILLSLLVLICLNVAYASENNTLEQTTDLKEINDSNRDLNAVQILRENGEKDHNYDFNTVQSLVDNAEDEDSIYLENGTYASNGNSIKIDKNIKIYGKGTILDANNLSGIFSVSEGGKLSLINISLINSKETAIENHGKLTIID